jgi:hypothetical protein
MTFSAFLRNIFRVVSLAICVAGCRGGTAETRHCATPRSIVDSTYRPGQIWSYKTRPGEEPSTVTILRVETLPKVGIIVHVRIDGVRFKNCTGGPAPNTIEHAPFTKIAMDKSVTHQLQIASELPDFETGYSDWLAHCGGVYTVSVAEMVDVDDTTFNAGLGCKK